ncbi:hypothetical protein OT109_16110 [Phycisphaeraceae bacterium D3-23]
MRGKHEASCDDVGLAGLALLGYGHTALAEDVDVYFVAGQPNAANFMSQAGDANADGVTDNADLQRVIANWSAGEPPRGCPPRARLGARAGRCDDPVYAMQETANAKMTNAAADEVAANRSGRALPRRVIPISSAPRQRATRWIRLP